MKTTLLYYTGELDDWSQEFLKDASGIQYLEVDGVPHHITNCVWQEPICPVKNYKIISCPENHMKT